MASGGRYGGSSRRMRVHIWNYKYKAKTASWKWWGSFLTASPSDILPPAKLYLPNLPNMLLAGDKVFIYGSHGDIVTQTPH